MNNTTVKNEKINIIGGKATISATICCTAKAVYPKVSALFCCKSESRILPMQITNADENQLLVEITVDTGYIFYHNKFKEKITVEFIFSSGTAPYEIIIPQKELSFFAQKRKISHFFALSGKEKAKIFASVVFSALALPYKNKAIDENRVTFISNRSDYLSGNIKSVFLEMTKVPNVEITVLCKKGGIEKNIAILQKFFKYYYTSKIVFVDDYYHLLSYVKKKDEVNLVQLWHACGAFKTFGYSRLGKDSSLHQSSPNHRQYDYAIVSSKQVVPYYAEGFGISQNKVLPLGSPRCDRFTDEEYKKYFTKKFYSENPDLKGKKIILFAPTFRGGGLGNCYYPTEKFESDRLLSATDKNTVIAVKMHPYLVERPMCSDQNKKRLIDFSDKYDVNDLLFVTDLLITDYSSVIYEASLLNIPMLFFTFDLDSYCKERDFYCDFKSFVPGKIVTTTDDMIKAIQSGDFNRELVMPFCLNNFDDTAGKATKNVVDFAKKLLNI